MLWTLPELQRGAGGLVPFDLRPGGYSHTEARAYLDALNAQGRALYQGPQYWLDMAYPVLFAVLFAWSFAAQARAMDNTGARLLCGLGGMASAMAAMADLSENRLIARMLEEGAVVSEALVTRASGWTVAKSAATTLAMTLLLIVMVWRGVRVWKQR